MKFISVANSSLRAQGIAIMVKPAAWLFVFIAANSVAAWSEVPAAEPANDKQVSTASGGSIVPVPADKAAPQANSADQIVQQIDDLSRQVNGQLPVEEYLAAHKQIAVLIGELRTIHPDDPRVPKYLPKRWLSMILAEKMGRKVDSNHVDLSNEMNAEIAEVLRTTADPVLKSDAGFYQAIYKIGEPIDGVAAASVAEQFAHEWPTDNRAAELLFNAAGMLNNAWYLRIVLAIALLATCLFAAVLARRSADRPNKRWLLKIVIALIGG